MYCNIYITLKQLIRLKDSIIIALIKEYDVHVNDMIELQVTIYNGVTPSCVFKWQELKLHRRFCHSWRQLLFIEIQNVTTGEYMIRKSPIPEGTNSIVLWRDLPRERLKSFPRVSEITGSTDIISMYNYIISVFHWNVTIWLAMKWSHDYKRDVSHPNETQM